MLPAADKGSEPFEAEGGDLARRIQRLELKAKRLASRQLLGRYRSRFRGRGIEFRDFREYIPGDEVRTIDWNVTARFGRPFVRTSEEERELNVVLILDLSPSLEFGSDSQTKLELARELTALLALTALRSGDRVGLLCLHGSGEPSFLPPSRGRHQKRRLLRALWGRDPVAPTAPSFSQSLDKLSSWLTSRAFLFLVSDFLLPEILEDGPTDALKRTLQKLSYRHETVALRVYDPRERHIPKVGSILLRDLGSGRTLRLDTDHPDWREKFQQRWRGWDRALHSLMTAAQWDLESFETGTDPLPLLSTFLDLRSRRR